jgi:diadenosine tetraphosphatase ApaH/serine/threonine PP2A family protein phosphatase
MKTAIIGDVHGCFDELMELIDMLNGIGISRLVYAGDLVHKGPNSKDVLQYVMASQKGMEDRILVVAGNHEENAMKGKSKGELEVSEEEIEWLKGLPLMVKLEDAGILVVHGGLYPAFFEHHGSLDESDFAAKLGDKGGGKRAERRRRFMRIRNIGQNGDMVSLGSEGPGTSHWSEWYDGRHGTVVYGHDPAPTVRESRFAIGIDTGCVHGGFLTALLVDERLTINPNSDIAPAYVVVKARQQYVPWLNTGD